MYTNENGQLIDSNDIDMSIERQEERDLKIYFMQNPYVLGILEDYLKTASELGHLDSAKAKKRLELTKNPILNYKLEELVKKNLLDKTRVKTLEIINNFKGEKND